MATTIITQEIYDDSGLVEVRQIEVEVPDVTDSIIAQKEQELLDMYTELQALKELRESQIN
jgi:hypothetical protein